jgi:Uma2 family endonuclease
MTTVSSPGDVVHPFTVSDLEEMPDDGRRYELIDGELLVSPAPGWAHQEAAYTLYMLLRQACPADMRVIGAPFAVRPDRYNEVQPDVLVARYGDLTPDDLPRAPLLAVEVISPTSRLRDASLKKAVYERLGAPSYWLVDPGPEKPWRPEPGPGQPSLSVFELTDRGYQQTAHVVGETSWTASQPFPVRVVPADLVRGLRP